MAFSIEKRVSLLRSQEQENRARQQAQKQGLYYADIKKVLIDPLDLGLLPEDKARRAKTGVIARIGKHLKLATVEPEKAKKIVEYFQSKGYVTSLFLISSQSFEKLLASYKEIPEKEQTDEISLNREEVKRLEKVRSLNELKKEIKQSSTTKLLNLLLGGGLDMRSSDIHLEPESHQATRIRFRIDGLLEDIAKIEQQTYQELLSRIKLLSKLKLNIKNTPQNGRFSIKAEEDSVDIRVSILPGPYGETVVLRLLNQKMAALDLEELGLNNENLARVKKELEKTTGLILITGPTGSGKTTTLYACLAEIHWPGIKIITIEDPIEYRLGGVVQTQIDERGGYTFSIGLKNALRQDPDVILVGEIRDSEGGSAAMNAALTGHLVFSTLHTNDSFGAIPRLIEMGVNPASIAPAINLIIAQRLVRRICRDCQGKGCGTCRQTGYKGRIGIFELLPVDDDIEELILTQMRPGIGQIKKYALKKGTRTMLEDGREKIRLGITTKEELSRVSCQ